MVVWFSRCGNVADTDGGRTRKIKIYSDVAVIFLKIDGGVLGGVNNVDVAFVYFSGARQHKLQPKITRRPKNTIDKRVLIRRYDLRANHAHASCAGQAKIENKIAVDKLTLYDRNRIRRENRYLAKKYLWRYRQTKN